MCKIAKLDFSMTDISFNIAGKKQKNDIKKFYKSERYSASLMGLDHVFIATDQTKIVASTIVSQIKNDNTHFLLHALVTNKKYQNKGIAGDLLQFAISHLRDTINNEFAETTRNSQYKPLTSIICFADKTLTQFYERNLFTRLSECESSHGIPEDLLLRYQSYKNKNNSLIIFERTIN